MPVVKRNKFRVLYQPSKVLLGVVPSQTASGVNVIALCFTTTCSYDPPMIAVAVEKKNYTYDLMKHATEFILAVPGESMAPSVMRCGLESGRNVDKFLDCGFTKRPSIEIVTPGIEEAIANIELMIEQRIDTGDHLTVIGRVVAYNVNPKRIEKNILAIGPNTTGYKLLHRRGLHRLAVVQGDDELFMESFEFGSMFRT